MNDQNFWPVLKPGDTIDMVAPGRKIPVHTLQDIADFFARHQLKVSYGENMQGSDLLCANTDEARFEHFKKALFNTETKIIWSIAGGYGAARVIPYLEKISQPPQAKIFIGISDATALHIFLNQRWGWPTIHGPSARQAVYKPIDPDCFKVTFALLSGKKNQMKFDLQPLNNVAKHTKELAGKIIGGNLSIVQTSLGTSWQLNGQEKIILLEDVQERPYRIDRMLEHLRQAKFFDHAKAVLFGDFTDCEKNNETPAVADVLKRFADAVLIPVFQCTGIGHGTVNYPLPLNTEIKITSDKLFV